MDYQAAGRKGGLATRGESKGTAKITADTVLAIREAEGTSLSIAQRYNLSRGYVSALRRKKAWAHL